MQLPRRPLRAALLPSIKKLVKEEGDPWSEITMRRHNRGQGRGDCRQYGDFLDRLSQFGNRGVIGLFFFPSFCLQPPSVPMGRGGVLVVQGGALPHERWSEACERPRASTGHLRCAPVHGEFPVPGAAQHTLETTAGSWAPWEQV